MLNLKEKVVYFRISFIPLFSIITATSVCATDIEKAFFNSNGDAVDSSGILLEHPDSAPPPSIKEGADFQVSTLEEQMFYSEKHRKLKYYYPDNNKRAFQGGATGSAYVVEKVQPYNGNATQSKDFSAHLTKTDPKESGNKKTFIQAYGKSINYGLSSTPQINGALLTLHTEANNPFHPNPKKGGVKYGVTMAYGSNSVAGGGVPLHVNTDQATAYGIYGGGYIQTSDNTAIQGFLSHKETKYKKGSTAKSIADVSVGIRLPSKQSFIELGTEYVNRVHNDSNDLSYTNLVTRYYKNTGLNTRFGARAETSLDNSTSNKLSLGINHQFLYGSFGVSASYSEADFGDKVSVYSSWAINTEQPKNHRPRHSNQNSTINTLAIQAAKGAPANNSYVEP